MAIGELDVDDLLDDDDDGDNEDLFDVNDPFASEESGDVPALNAPVVKRIYMDEYAIHVTVNFGERNERRYYDIKTLTVDGRVEFSTDGDGLIPVYAETSDPIHARDDQRTYFWP